MRTVFTHSLVCTRNLTRSLRLLVRFPILDQLVRKYRTHTLAMKYSIFVTYFVNISIMENNHVSLSVLIIAFRLDVSAK